MKLEHIDMLFDKEVAEELKEQFKTNLSDILEDNYELNKQFHTTMKECIYSFATAHYDEKLTFEDWKNKYYGK